MKVAVCICTLHREMLLDSLLRALQLQRLAFLKAEDVIIVVVDNSADRTASKLCSAVSSQSVFKLHYVHEPRRGLSFARNAAVKTALSHDMAFVAFIDDDERPSLDWLDTLARSIDETGSAAVVGLVKPSFECHPPQWVVDDGIHTKRLQQFGATGLKDGHTANSIIDLQYIDHESPFDLHFNQIGGEDTILFHRILQRGGRIAWSEEAYVHDFIPNDRLRRKWILFRWFRTGHVEAHLSTYKAFSLRWRGYNLLRGLMRVVVGLGRIAASLARPRRQKSLTSSAYTFVRGLGLISTSLGVNYTEYRSRNGG